MPPPTPLLRCTRPDADDAARAPSCARGEQDGFSAASEAARARYTEALRHEVWQLGIQVTLVEAGAFTAGVLDASTAAQATIAGYDGPRENACRTLHRALDNGEDPAEVAKLICSVAQARRSRGRYGAGRQSWWVPRLKTVLPQRVFDSLPRWGYHLPR
ncbi:hypothetical protein [Actinomadura madurae]|uniref:hypothetical protein n=1 Tax=Actinomadura madurae TaxID=1993 RepID=UPI0020D215D7|nr:hypothetical protein [Actinomadura madurae]MCP9952707.1 hypothetical protein [Actinomadura madurae]MCQ0006546.1 hypothetical protein [Actinomadura madurae]